MPQVFDRYEVKYILPIDLAEKFRASLMANGMAYDKFNLHRQRYGIRSIYYGQLSEIVSSYKVPFEKRIFNQRIRVRTYGTAHDEDDVFLEIKKKFNGRTNKHRTSLTYEDYQDVLEDSVQSNESQVTKEVKYLIDKKELVPYLYLAYDRLAFKMADSDLRISFDTNVRSRSTDLDLKQDTHNTYLIDDGLEVMEIKTAYGVPDWLNELLEQFELRPQKYSKFMEATGLKEGE